VLHALSSFNFTLAASVTIAGADSKLSVIYHLLCRHNALAGTIMSISAVYLTGCCIILCTARNQVMAKGAFQPRKHVRAFYGLQTVANVPSLRLFIVINIIQFACMRHIADK
jgi:hypothetical protein